MCVCKNFNACKNAQSEREIEIIHHFTGLQLAYVNLYIKFINTFKSLIMAQQVPYLNDLS